MTTKHRKCGCDCNDQTRWVEDAGILQATFDCGCTDNAKPPCVYWANFECAVSYRREVFPSIDQRERPYSRGTNYQAEQLRPTCKWGPEGRYVSFRDQDTATFINYTKNALYYAANHESCTWDDVLRFGDVPPGQTGYLTIGRHPDAWQAMEQDIRWTLTITESPVKLIHFGGARYVQKTDEQWDCFGPNTLWLDKDPIEYPDYSTLPKFVCVTPDVYAVKSEPASCNQCYSTTIPSISATEVSIPSQKLEFLRAGIENEGENFFGFETQGSVNSPFLFKGLTAKDELEGREFCQLTFVDPIVVGQTSRATLQFPIDLDNYGGQYYGNYYCDRFTCGEENTFVKSSGSALWPSTLILAPSDCTRSDQHMWGPCWKSDGPLDWEDGYPAGSSDDVRKDCCDPWCSCAPGWLKVFNPSGSYLFQEFGGLTTSPESSTAFCAGGRYGREDPSSVSREWCVENVYAADGTTHQVCMVLYCGSLGGGVTWLIDWYCDGTFVATRNMNQVLNCCPNQMAQLGPEMPCLPGAVLCVGINIEPACEPLCCTNQPNTLYITFTSTCPGLTGQSVALTKTGDNYWLNPFVFSGFYIIDLQCTDGNWTLGIYATGCTTYLYSNQIACEPFVFGNFGPITLTCVGPLCSIGDTVSVVLSA